ncbi:putative DNA-binding transcriptional regulator YafY [Haloactinopolyspora alba]|uniref:Putative DNA-binding transcriptional regulator YafY n=1 Tax=Haloactinopolyspora alba TaxID=648780 RepID=A0A2P8DXY9_9ACTN|nr:putative DNA-binding transcriptional regulator YafY [Haloactinopolyspora alba]
MPADELAERLDVDPRSVRRYVAALRELGIPVTSTRGRYGGYRLAHGYRLPPLMLSDDEAVSAAVALAAASRAAAADVPSPTDQALVKLNRVLPMRLRQRVNAMLEVTDVLPDGRASVTPDPEVTLTLGTAVRQRRRVRIEHVRADGSATTRDVDPYGLVVHARRWYLVGHDHLRTDVRMFRADRIGRAAELPHRFVVPAGFDPVEHVRQGLTLGAWTHRTEVWLDTTVDEARHQLPSTFGELHACPDGGVVVVSGVEDLSGMARALASLPWRFAVRGPEALVEAVRAHVASLRASVDG